MYINVDNIGRDIREILMDKFALYLDSDSDDKEIQFIDEAGKSFFEREDQDKPLADESEVNDILADEEDNDDNYIRDYFEYIREQNKSVYNTIIGVIFVDYYVTLFSYNLFDLEEGTEPVDLAQFRHFESSADVATFLDKNPEYFLPMIKESVDFCLLEPEEKRTILNRCRGMERYLVAINPFHILDKLEYCRPITKEDIIVKQREIFAEYAKIDDENEVSPEKIIENKELNNELAIGDVANYLRNIFYISESNYRNLILELISDYYKYSQYKKRNNEQYDPSLLDIIETSSLTEIINITINERPILEDILTVIVEYYYHDLKVQRKINAEVAKVGNPDIKKLLLRKDKKKP